MNKTQRNKLARQRQTLLALLNEGVTPAVHKGNGVTINVDLLAALTQVAAQFAVAVAGNVHKSATAKTLRNSLTPVWVYRGKQKTKGHALVLEGDT